MIKANELRIGNIIATNSTNSIELVTGYRIGQMSLNNEDIIPIQLTEEWLLKFGFENNKLRIGVYDLVVVLPNSAFYNGVGFPCKYAHQLQNLYFALTGEELQLTK